MMTVTLDKKVIHIGWETAAAIIIFTIATTWGLFKFTYGVTQGQKDMTAALVVISKHDTSYANRLDKLEGKVSTVITSVNTLRDTVQRKITFVSERNTKYGTIVYPSIATR